MIQNRILIPVGGSESARENILYLTSITPRSDTRITLLHDLPPSHDVSSGNAHADEIHDALLEWSAAPTCQPANAY